MLNLIARVVIALLIALVAFLWMVMLGSGHKILPENNIPFALAISILIALFILLKRMKKKAGNGKQ